MIYKVETQGKQNGGAWSLRWTTEAPKELGLYFALLNGVVMVVDFSPADRRVEFIGSDEGEPVRDITHWLGPLPIPEPPK